MRRKDREIVDIGEMIQIIQKCDVCTLALFDEEYPYIVPMNFGWDCNNSQIDLYFHCANEGKKLELIQKNHKVSFEMDCSHKLISGERPCDCTMEYESVVGNGTIEIVNANKEKALTAIMKNYSKEKTFEFDERMLRAVTVLKLTVEKITAKHLKVN